MLLFLQFSWIRTFTTLVQPDPVPAPVPSPIISSIGDDENENDDTDSTTTTTTTATLSVPVFPAKSIAESVADEDETSSVGDGDEADIKELSYIAKRLKEINKEIKDLTERQVILELTNRAHGGLTRLFVCDFSKMFFICGGFSPILREIPPSFGGISPILCDFHFLNFISTFIS